VKNLSVLILCPSDVGNPYVVQLIRGLNDHSCIEKVQHGLFWLVDPPHFDVVHIQWPEALTKWLPPSQEQINFIAGALARWKSNGSRIVATIHNVLPHHKSKGHVYKLLYDAVYAFVDTVIHLGHASHAAIKDVFPNELDLAAHVVIPHGNYQYFKDISRGRRLAFFKKRSGLRFLIFGQLRHQSEVKILQQAARSIRESGGQLAIVGRLPSGSRRLAGHYTTRLPFWLDPTVSVLEAFVDDEDVAGIIEATDVVFIARTDSINSGNVALGFTFGKVVVGPDIGVIGETLRNTGNPVYEVGKFSSISESLQRAQTSYASGLGATNLAYADSELSWERITDLHVKAYLGCERGEARQ